MSVSETKSVSNEDNWKIVEAYFRQHSIAATRLESYNDFIRNIVPGIINEHSVNIEPRYDDYKRKSNEDSKNHINYRVTFHNAYVSNPTFKESSDQVRHATPQECIERNLSYVATLYADIEITDGVSTYLHKKECLGQLPTMVFGTNCNLFPHIGNEPKLYELKECPYNPGGYYILEGQKKAITTQEKQTPNDIFLFENRKAHPKFELYTECRSGSDQNGISSMHSTLTQVGLLSSGISLAGSSTKEKKRLISVIVPYLPEGVAIPISVIFRALGATSIQDILRYTFGSRHIDLSDEYNEIVLNVLIPSLEYFTLLSSQQQALIFIAKKGKKYDMAAKKAISHLERNDEIHDLEEEFDYMHIDDDKAQSNSDSESISYATRLLSDWFLPQCRGNFVRKMYFLGRMLKRLLDGAYRKQKDPKVKVNDDRDHCKNKRFDADAYWLGSQLSGAFNRMCKDAKKAAETLLAKGSKPNILSLFKSSIITNSMKSGLSQNKWNKGGAAKSSVSQAYETFNYSASLANLRKISTAISADGGKVTEPRNLHGSHYGYKCPSETPEGKRAGLNTVEALSMRFTLGCDAIPIIELFKHLPKQLPFYSIEDIESSTDDDKLQKTPIFVNGDFIGTTTTPNKLIKYLRALRRRGNFSNEVSLIYDDIKGEVRVWTDGGRLTRPLLTLERGRLVFNEEHVKKLTPKSDTNSPPEWTFADLLKNGIVEYIDSDEQEFTLIASYPSDLISNPEDEVKDVTHCEIHPSLMYGVTVGLIPFPDHNQAPRNSFAAAMSKQACGIPFLNYFLQVTGKFNVLMYPQRPLSMTRVAKLLHCDEMAVGQNVVVFVCNWKGFGQEDATIWNRDSIQRGCLSILHYVSFYSQVKCEKGEKMEVAREEVCNRFKGKTEKLDPATGVVKIGAKVKYGDVLIGMTQEIKGDDRGIHRKPFNDISIIYDEAQEGTVDRVQFGENGEGYPYVRVMVTQLREIEVGDKMAQHNAQKGTCAVRVPSCDLPFTADGIVPDVVFNSCGIPSRMTMSMFLQILLGHKVADSSPLHHIELQEFMKKMDKTTKMKVQTKVKSSVKKKFDEDDSLSKEEKKEVIKMTYKEECTVEYSRRKKKEPLGILERRIDDNRVTRGKYADATPFLNASNEGIIDMVYEELRKLGLNPMCESMVYDGQTGKPIPTLVFHGPVYYSRLKHMARDKIYSAARSRKNAMTHQPREGVATFKIPIDLKKLISHHVPTCA